MCLPRRIQKTAKTQSADVSSELEELRAQLEKANSELDRLQRQLHDIVKAHEKKLEKER